MNRIIVLCVLAIGLLGGCSGSASDPAAQKQEVRVYPVPAEQTDALMKTLNQVFQTSEKTAIGKVSSPRPGQLVVLAPADLQGSIEASLRNLMKDLPATAKPAENKPDGPLRLTFWSVDAVPVSGDDDPTLAALAPALDEARKQLGMVHFELRDQVSGVSSVNQSVERSWPGVATGGRTPEIRQLQYTLRKNGESLSLSLTFGDQIPVGQPGSVQYLSTGSTTTTAIRLGQTLVVTQNPIPDTESTGNTPSNLTRLYLVRVDEVPAT